MRAYDCREFSMNPSLDEQNSSLKTAALIVGVGVLYYYMARFGLWFSYRESHASSIWPPAGLALAAMLLLGWRVWPGIWLGAFAASVVAFVYLDGAAPFTGFWVSAAIATGNSFEVMAGWWLSQCWLERFARPGQEEYFIAGANVFRFAAMAVTMCIPSACIGPTAICAAGFEPWSKFPLLWTIWWIGDASAVLLFTPFLIAWTRPLKIRWCLTRALEGIAAFGALVVSNMVAFGGWLPARPVTYLPMVPLVWISLRQSPRAVAGALLLLAVSAIEFTYHQQGHFASLFEQESILILLVFLWMVAITCMVLAGSVAARRKLANELEERVEARTAESKKTNAALQLALEKEVVLRREINHRVKNNLQVISSLLFLQATKIEDPVMHELLRESQARVRSLSLIYDKLSEQGKVAGIAFPEYVEQLATEVFVAYRVSKEAITLKIEAEGIFLDLDTAVPCALILTELISNALKYAFPGDRKGELLISIHSIDEGRLCLTVKDNGIGIPEGHQMGRAKSMGMGLVHDLTRQLNGQIEFHSQHGATVKIIFPSPPLGQKDEPVNY